MDDILVSVICNTYNHEQYIAQALDSFLMQKTNFTFEVLVHDDASTDSTAEIIKEYEMKYPDVIKPIYQKENQYSKSIPFMTNFQYPRAKGRYVAFCEGDDFWIDENKLQMQVDFLEKNNDFIGCVHKYEVVDEDNRKQDVITFGYYEHEGKYTIEDFQKIELPSQLASFMCRNIFIEEGKKYPKKFDGIYVQGDIKIYLYVLSYGDIFRMDNTSSAYRFVFKRGGSSWSSKQITAVTGYKTWCGLRELEYVYESLYGRKIELRERKIRAAIQTIRDIEKEISVNNLANAMKVLVLQRGVISKSALILFKKLTKK